MRDRRRIALVLAAGAVVLGHTRTSHAARTWSGAGPSGGSGATASMVVGSNYVGGASPTWGSNSANTDVVFTGNTNTTITVPNEAVVDILTRNVTFAGAAGAFTFVSDGSPTLPDHPDTDPEVVLGYVGSATDVIINNSPFAQTFNVSSGSHRGQIIANTGDFVFNAQFFIGNGSRFPTPTTFAGAANFYLNGNVVGDTDLVKIGTGTVFINGNASTYTGAFYLTNGVIQINSSSGLGASGIPDAHQHTEISSSAGTLALTNNINVGEYFKLDGRGNTTAHISNVSGHNTLSGTIVSNSITKVGTDLSVDPANPNITISSDGTAPGDSLEISGLVQQLLVGNQPLILTGAGNGLVSGSVFDNPGATTWSIVKNGAGTWTLDSGGFTNVGGVTTILQGTLAIKTPAAINGTPGIVVKSPGIFDVTQAGGYSLNGSQSLKGNGTVLGAVTINGGTTLIPGDIGTAGTLTMGDLNLNGGTVQLDLGASAAATSDDIVVNGNLSLSGATTLAINKLVGSVATGTYRLFDYTGNLNGDSSNLNVSVGAGGTTRQTFLVDTSVAKQVNLIVGGSAASLTWVGGANSNAWDVDQTVNWTGAPGATPDNHFFNGDAVTFTDSGSNAQTISLSSVIAPGAATFTNSAAHPYTFSGGDLLIATDLTVTSTGDVTFANNAVAVSGNVAAAGSGTLTFANSGSTTFGGSVSTSGSRNLVIANSGNPVAIAGNLTVGGTGSLNVSGGPVSIGGSLNSATTGNVTFANSDLTISGGVSQNGTGTVLIANTGSLSLPNSITLSSGTLALQRNDTVAINHFNGTGTFKQQGSGTVILTGNNTNFGGAIIVASGVMQLGQSSTNPLGTGAAGTTVISGATLDVNSTFNDTQIVTISGTGAPGQQGALVDTSARGTSNTVRSRTMGVILNGDATIFAPTNTFPYVANPLGDAIFNGNGHAVTLAGAGEWDIVDAGETHLGNIVIKDGLGGDGEYWVGSTTWGDQPGVITLQNDGMLAIQRGTASYSKPIVVPTDGSGNGGLIAWVSSATVDSPITINGTFFAQTHVRSSPDNQTLTLTGQLTGPGSLAAHTLFLTGGGLGVQALTNDNNNFGGTITIGGGYGAGIGLIKATGDRAVLSIGNGGTTGSLPGGDVTIFTPGTLLFNVNKTLNFPNKITGTGIVAISAGAVTLTGNLSYTGATNVNGGLLRVASSIASSGVNVNAGGTFEAASTQTLNALTINPSGRAQIASAAGSKKILTVNNGTFNGGVMDVNDGELILPYSGTSPAAGVRALLASGFNVGSWDGLGINSTAAHNNTNSLTALGYNDNGTQVIVDYTYYGDSDLSGNVTTTDFQMYLDGFATGGSTWAQGDYTYDGNVDLGNDFNLFLVTYLKQGGALGDLAPIVAADDQLSVAQKSALLSFVPEPSSLTVLGFGAAALAARRRRRVN